MQLGPRFNQPMLTPGELASDNLNDIYGVHRYIILIVSMKMRPMVWRVRLGVHPNNDPEKTREFRHPPIIARRRNDNTAVRDR